jgi:hypothetical protein
MISSNATVQRDGPQVRTSRDPSRADRHRGDQRCPDSTRAAIDHRQHDAHDEELPEVVHTEVEQRQAAHHQAQDDEQTARPTPVRQVPERHGGQQPEQPRDRETEPDLCDRQSDDPVEVQDADRHQQAVADPAEQSGES